MPVCRSPIDLYLPRQWINDRSRRAKAHIPRAIRFKTKPLIALEQIRAALLARVSPGVVLMDASYGSNSGLREAITGLGLSYVAAIMSTVKVRPVRKGDPKPRRLSVEALALKRPKHTWRTITWREGTNKWLQSRFARVRVRVTPMRGEARFAEGTLLIEWPQERGRAHQDLARNRRPQHVVPRPRRPRQAALAHRARLSRPQAGNRPRAL
jgi:SRSO17 transposase